MFDNIAILTEAPIFNIQLILDGLFIGATFALAAYGLALVWGVMNVKNLAQGDFVIMGGYIAWWLSTQGVHPLWGLPVAVVVMFAFGWALYVLIIRWVVERDMFISLLATFALALIITQTLTQMFGPEVQTAESHFAVRSYLDNTITVADIRLISFGLCCVLAIAVVTFMKNSRMGQAIRATAQDPRAAKVMGIDTDQVYAFTFSLNAAICGAAGSLIVMIWNIQPFFGIGYSIRSFVIVTAAGFGNLPGVIAMGLGMGVIEGYGGFVFGAEFQQAIVVGMLVAVLVYRQIDMRRTRQVVQ